jgi:hypothetical protein
MERKPQIEDLLSQIKLLELSLEFYANENNYPEMVNIDIGNQARFALKQIKDTDKYTDDLIENFNKAIEGRDDIDQEQIDKALEMINKIKEGFSKL